MDIDRKSFLTAGAAFAARAVLGQGAAKPAPQTAKDDFIWAHMPQFGMNMWGDFGEEPVRTGSMCKYLTDAEFADLCRPEWRTHAAVRFDEAIWRELAAKLRANGCNLILIDVGEFVVYPSHPELAVKGSWKAERLQAEVRRLKQMGFDVAPKINFSCCHDAWLKEYARQVSTATYYRVTADLIRDVCEIFDKPRFVHLGMDEEDIVEYQARNTTLVRIRQNDLWWHDVRFFIDEVEKHGARAWMWSDYLRRHPVADFVKKMPKSAVQSPWTYSVVKPSFDIPNIRLFGTLAENGYDVIPCGSNCYGFKENFHALEAFCRANLPKEHFKGMLFAPWMMTASPWKRLLLEGADIFGQAVRDRAAGR